MLKFWDHRGVLGINARNLLYIKPLNQKAQVQFADDKMRTKQYLAARGINTARLYGKITSEAELLNFPWDSLPNDFVLKPNAGYGGEGIIVIKNREGDGWLTVKDEYFSPEDMIEHVTDVLDGRYSITNNPDSVFFEQRLVSHRDMQQLGKFGLPDIRVIVYNLVPVMAMVRIPTPESKGKANVHMGGLACGIDLAKGEITHMSHYNSILSEHPDLGNLRGLKIPFWDEVLLLATQIQQMITLGYLAVDIVIDEDLGPSLLEINARAGLNVQIANLAPLRDRLDRVAGVKVQNPEKGVRMAQDLFGNKVERRIQALSGKKVIGMDEEVILNLKHGTKAVTARMNPSMNKNYLEENLFKNVLAGEEADKITLGYSLAGERGKSLFYPLEMKQGKYQMILGKKALANFFLDVSREPEKKKIPDLKKPHPPRAQKSDESLDLLRKADTQLCDWDRSLSLIASLRPQNLSEEKATFFATPDYEPQFVYKPLSDQMIRIDAQLDSLRISPDTAIGKLLEAKRQELIQKSRLMKLIGDDERFPDASRDLIGYPPDDVIREAEQELSRMTKPGEIKRTLSSDQAAKRMQSALKDRGILHWEVKTKIGLVSRCVVGKNNRLLIRAGEMFAERDLDKLIAHEIETHVFCAENGKMQPFQIFRRGTAHYLKTQEGLAIYHQNQVVPKSIRNAVLGLQAIVWAQSMGFREVYEKALAFCSPEEAWSLVAKVKRGMSDTGKAGAFTKNALYYWGYLEVKQYIESGGNWADLFLGKYAIEDLALVKEVAGLRSARHVPNR